VVSAIPDGHVMHRTAESDRFGCPVVRRSDAPLLERFERSLVRVRDMALAINAWENHWRLRGVIAATPTG
jgi:hypothetical protein